MEALEGVEVEIGSMDDLLSESSQDQFVDIYMQRDVPFYSVTSSSPAFQTESSSITKNYQNLMEKHRQSERFRHHSLNEQLRVICQIIPGCDVKVRETKVVMMQRVISYITFLENTLQVLCELLCLSPLPSWTLLTSAFKQFLTDEGECNGFTMATTSNIMSSLLVSSPTVDSTTDIAMPMQLQAPDIDLPATSDDLLTPPFTSCYLDSQIFCPSLTGTDDCPDGSDAVFHCLAEDGISAVFEVSSTTAVEICPEDPLGIGFTCLDTDRCLVNRSDHSVSCISETFTSDTFGQSSKGYETIDSHDVEDRNSAGFHKRKQTSQKRSMFGGKHVSAHVHISPDTDQFYPQADVSYTENVSTNAVDGIVSTSACGDCHYDNRDFESASTTDSVDYGALEYLTVSREETIYDRHGKDSKFDLRKTSWMNGFMMFSRMKRRKFIQEHRGMQTSNISKMLGYAWRNMPHEEKEYYKQKASLCSQELYQAYTSQPIFSANHGPVNRDDHGIFRGQVMSNGGMSD